MKKISACPRWLSLSDDRRSFVFEPERAAIVRMIFELSIGGLGSYAIAERLNRQGVRPFGPSTTWDNTTVDSMLRNRATLGEFQPKSWAGGHKRGIPIGLPLANYYPAVIDEATFQAAQAARRRHLASGRGRKGNNYANLFTGIATCSYCSSPIKIRNSSNPTAKTMVCEQVLDGTSCVRNAWSYKNFEASVLHFLVHPALMQQIQADQKKVLGDIVCRIRELGEDEDYDLRTDIALMLRNVVAELRLANAGRKSLTSEPGAMIRRDNRERYFELKLWNGPSYIGLPVPLTTVSR